jgi:hypothetical protein
MSAKLSAEPDLSLAGSKALGGVALEIRLYRTQGAKDFVRNDAAHGNEQAEALAGSYVEAWQYCKRLSVPTTHVALYGGIRNFIKRDAHRVLL